MSAISLEPSVICVKAIYHDVTDENDKDYLTARSEIDKYVQQNGFVDNKCEILVHKWYTDKNGKILVMDEDKQKKDLNIITTIGLRIFL